MTHGAPSPYVLLKEYEKFKEFQFGSTKVILPALRLDNNTVIYVLNIMGGNPELVTFFAEDLLDGLDAGKGMDNVVPVDGFISAEGKSIPLVYEMAIQAELPYVVLRKTCKSYMGEKVLSSKVKTITTGDEELYLDNKDLKLLVGKRLIFIDDVISSGATLNATRKIVDMAGGEVAGCLAMAVEGDYKPTLPAYWLARLPIIKLMEY